MKLLYLHAKDLRIEAGVGGVSEGKKKQNERRLRKRIGEYLPQLDENSQKQESKNALLGFVCVEKGDEKLDLNMIKEDILSRKKFLGVPEIVVGSFGHLSATPAEAGIAKKIIDELVALLSAAEKGIKSFPFGWDKSLELKVPLHSYNVSFASFEPLAEGKTE